MFFALSRLSAVCGNAGALVNRNLPSRGRANPDKQVNSMLTLISKIGLDRATHMSRGAKNEAREIQSAPYWSDHFRDIVVIGC